MAKQNKKAMRKTKDKIVHAANDVKAIMQEEIPDEQWEILDKVHSKLIEATNDLVKATNFRKPHEVQE
jgi:hypothetical protein